MSAKKQDPVTGEATQHAGGNVYIRDTGDSRNVDGAPHKIYAMPSPDLPPGVELLVIIRP